MGPEEGFLQLHSEVVPQTPALYPQPHNPLYYLQNQIIAEKPGPQRPSREGLARLDPLERNSSHCRARDPMG